MRQHQGNTPGASRILNVEHCRLSARTCRFCFCCLSRDEVFDEEEEENVNGDDKVKDDATDGEKASDEDEPGDDEDG